MKENLNSSNDTLPQKQPSSSAKTITCPLCNQEISDLKEKINMHLEECFSVSKLLPSPSKLAVDDLLSRYKRKQAENRDEVDGQLNKRTRTNNASFDDSQTAWNNNSGSAEDPENEDELNVDECESSPRDSNSNYEHKMLNKEDTMSKCVNCKVGYTKS